MIYLSHFEFPGREREYDLILGRKRTCYDTVYPFQILSKHSLQMPDFEPITILYGSNGSGKTTALNVIGEKLEYLENTARFFGCQIIMATHSPFLLSMRGAKIYDLDAEPVDVKPWTELGNVREYYEFFRQHRADFGD